MFFLMCVYCLSLARCFAHLNPDAWPNILKAVANGGSLGSEEPPRQRKVHQKVHLNLEKNR